MIKQMKLNGTWSFSEEGSNTLYPVQIPGSIISGLLDNKVIEDPYYRENETYQLELSKKDYRFCRTFNIEETQFEQEVIELVCESLDTLCEVFLNGVKIAETNNMHRCYRFSVKEYLGLGENRLEILVISPMEYISNVKPEEGNEITFTPCEGVYGNQYLRKAHSMFGWDWGIFLPDGGIVRDIYLEAYSVARISEVLFSQEHIINNKGQAEQVILHVTPRLTDVKSLVNQEEFLVEVRVSLNQIEVANGICIGNNTLKLVIAQPELWWPNGYGEQPLYEVHCVLKQKTVTLDEKKYTIGFRTLTISTEKDQWGSEFAFVINGIKIFTKGANYIPEDAIYSRITSERMEYLIDASLRAHYNCLRIWGGGYYPSDEFYNLCDRAGLIVWQDFMYACNIYDLTKEFEETIIWETRDNIQRLRHHACLGIWCGNNEMETAWDHWGGFKDHSRKLKADYIKMFEYIIPKIKEEEDKETFYWPSSPSSGGNFHIPDSPDHGDTHYWDVWHGQKPFTDYLNHYFRFCSEFGFQSFPSIKTVETFTEVEDRNIFSKVMERHQKNNSANGKILYYISENFKYPKDFESLLYVSQVLQGLAIKTGVEHFRRNRGRCMGSLYWQLNDNWPVASWSSVDYFGRYKALHYMAMTFYNHVAGSAVLNKTSVAAYIQNETRFDVSCQIVMRLKTFDFQILWEEDKKVMIPALTPALVMEKEFQELILGKEEQVFVEITFIHQDGRKQIETQQFVPYKYLQLPKATVMAAVSETDLAYEIHLTSDYFAPFTAVDLKHADGIFSDNFIPLTSSDGTMLTLNKKDITRGQVSGIEDLYQKLVITTLTDSFL
jgi:beta-mannosidase